MSAEFDKWFLTTRHGSTQESREAWNAALEEAADLLYWRADMIRQQGHVPSPTGNRYASIYAALHEAREAIAALRTSPGKDA